MVTLKKQTGNWWTPTLFQKPKFFICSEQCTQKQDPVPKTFYLQEETWSSALLHSNNSCPYIPIIQQGHGKNVHLQEATWSSGRWDLATSKSVAPHSKQPPTGSFLSCWERAVFFADPPDFGKVLILDRVFVPERFQLPVVAILPQGWLHLFEDLVKQLDLLVLLPANRNLFFYFLYFILWSCKV